MTIFDEECNAEKCHAKVECLLQYRDGTLLMSICKEHVSRYRHLENDSYKIISVEEAHAREILGS